MPIQDLLKTLVRDSVLRCYANDRSLIRRGMEQAAVARIYYYMQTAISEDARFTRFKDYNLDCEYYKNMDGLKITPRFQNGTKPDMILHFREDTPRRDNVLIIEFKRKSISGDDSIPNRDKKKLEDFTSEESVYHFKLGVFVRLNEPEAVYRYFENGQEMIGIQR